METMKVSVLRGQHDVVTEERAVPVPAPDEVLVQVASVGVCGSDMHYYEHGRIGPHVVKAPLVLGHEASGVVAQVGSEVTSLTVGQRVSVEPGVPCRACAQCLRGRYNLCPDVKFFATPPYDGAFCEFVAMPESFVYAVPDHVSDDAAGLLEPLSVGVWANRRSQVSPDDAVLVSGAGPIGLASAMAARAYGARSVVVADVNPHRIELSRELGFEAVDVSQRPLGEAGVSADVLLECSGNARATWDAILAVAPAGRVALVGMGQDEVGLPLPHIQDHELTLTGAFRYANTWPTAIDLVASGRVDLDALVTGHFGLEQVEDALTAPSSDPRAVKSMVCPGRS
jgi:L-iditol 2-dehydrogenase